MQADGVNGLHMRTTPHEDKDHCHNARLLHHPQAPAEPAAGPNTTCRPLRHAPPLMLAKSPVSLKPPSPCTPECCGPPTSSCRCCSGPLGSSCWGGRGVAALRHLPAAAAQTCGPAACTRTSSCSSRRLRQRARQQQRGRLGGGGCKACCIDFGQLPACPCSSSTGSRLVHKQRAERLLQRALLGEVCSRGARSSEGEGGQVGCREQRAEQVRPHPLLPLRRPCAGTGRARRPARGHIQQPAPAPAPSVQPLARAARQCCSCDCGPAPCSVPSAFMLTGAVGTGGSSAPGLRAGAAGGA
jgi:hypothetical protein